MRCHVVPISKRKQKYNFEESALGFCLTNDIPPGHWFTRNVYQVYGSYVIDVNLPKFGYNQVYIEQNGYLLKSMCWNNH